MIEYSVSKKMRASKGIPYRSLENFIWTCWDAVYQVSIILIWSGYLLSRTSGCCHSVCRMLKACIEQLVPFSVSPYDSARCGVTPSGRRSLGLNTDSQNMENIPSMRKELQIIVAKVWYRRERYCHDGSSTQMPLMQSWKLYSPTMQDTCKNHIVGPT